MEDLDELRDIVGVEADGGLFQDIEDGFAFAGGSDFLGGGGGAAGELGDEFDALSFAAA